MSAPDSSGDPNDPHLRHRLVPKRAGADAETTNTAPAPTSTTEQQFNPPKASPDQSKVFFDDSVTIPDTFRELLEKYSHVPPEEADEHVLQLRNRAWEVHPYPCLGQFRFLELNLASRGDLYTRLLTTLKSGGRFLDVGCCLGQDIRKLIFDGAPASSVAGAELNAAFIELGYDLFKDKDGLEAPMVAANILEPVTEESPLVKFRGQLSVVQLGMILHLFSWEEQVRGFENAIRLLKDEKGTLVIGQASGNLDGIKAKLNFGKGTFRHNVKTFEDLIKDVEAKTATQWKVKAELDNGLSIFDGKRTWDDPKTRRLLFVIERA